MKINGRISEEPTLICEDCGSIINHVYHCNNAKQMTSNPVVIPFVENFNNNASVTRVSGHQHSRTLTAGTVMRYMGQTGAGGDNNLTAGTEIVLDGNRVVNIKRPAKRNEMRCWSCTASTSPGPWHRHKTIPNKFLCDVCLNYYKQRNEPS